jgi:uncharacterized protein
MKNTYFLNTSYILALEMKTDINYQIALQSWLNLTIFQPFIITTTYIFDEVVTFLNSRNLHYKAVEIGDRLITGSDFELVEVDKNLFREDWEYFKKHRDKSYSLTDCISFVVMEKRQISTALTLDHHFVQVGFQKLP